jgi:hypothetical protein
MNKNKRALCVSFLTLLVTSLSHAQIKPPTQKGDNQLNIGPLYGPPRDRLIVVDLDIKQDGTVGNTDVVNGFFDDSYEAGAVPALRKLRFDPAMLNGAPVDFYGYRIVLTTRTSFAASTHPGFQGDYEKVAALTQSGDFAGAESFIQSMIKSRIVTVFEYAFLNSALVPIYTKLQRPYDALRASRNATLRSGHQEAEYFVGTRIKANDPSWPYFLPKEMLANALRQRFAVALALERYGEANAAYRELNALEPLPADDPIAVLATDLEKRRRSPEPLTTHGKIAKGEWEYSPTRRVISVRVNPAASIRSLDVKCSLHRETRSLDPEVKWVLPPTWGPCTLMFRGDDNAEVLVTENMLPGPGVTQGAIP